VDEPALTDLHVHTEWSSDAPFGSMERTCERAAAAGLPAIAFTDHADFDGAAPPLDLDGYLATVERCRDRFPDLRILTGVELGEAHRFRSEADALLARRPLDMVLGSCHSIPVGDRLVNIGEEGTLAPAVAAGNVRAFFAETLALVETAPVFSALTHLDYPKRYWPHEALAYDERDFEEEYRGVLAAAASAGLALEINTNKGELPHGPCPGPVAVRWWWEEGGGAVTFASDAHEPGQLLAGFDVARGIAEAAGFRQAAHEFGFWLRRAPASTGGS
jgi:histidinol-phosphatase (PHP family)